MLNDSVSHPVVTLRGRYRLAADTLVLDADLSEHRVVESVLEDHDIDQVVAWARIEGRDDWVLQSAQFLHVRALEQMHALRSLPWGAQQLAADLRAFVEEHGVAVSDMARPLSLDALAGSGPALVHQAAPPIDASQLQATADRRVRIAIDELLACREEWPEHRPAGALAELSAALERVQATPLNGPGRSDCYREERP